jgi:hypothetical protein
MRDVNPLSHTILGISSSVRFSWDCHIYFHLNFTFIKNSEQNYLWWWNKHQRLWSLVPLFPLKGLGYASTHPQRNMRVIPCLHPSVLKIFHFHYYVSLYRRSILTIFSGQKKKFLHRWGEPQRIGTQLLLYRFKKSAKKHKHRRVNVVLIYLRKLYIFFCLLATSHTLIYILIFCEIQCSWII